MKCSILLIRRLAISCFTRLPDPAIYMSSSRSISPETEEYTFSMKEVVMAHKITDACLACGTCVPECPVEAISEGDPIYVIDADKCTDCGSCVEACPTEAITPA